MQPGARAPASADPRLALRAEGQPAVLDAHVGRAGVDSCCPLSQAVARAARSRASAAGLWQRKEQSDQERMLRAHRPAAEYAALKKSWWIGLYTGPSTRRCERSSSVTLPSDHDAPRAPKKSSIVSESANDTATLPARPSSANRGRPLAEFARAFWMDAGSWFCATI
jgi:hypothetical protein